MVELNLTKRQREIFDFIKRYSSEHGYPPTVRDIGKAIGLTSSSTVHAHLSNVEDFVDVPQLAGGDEGEYLLRVRGDSMKDAGILDGDFVVVHRQDTANNGEMVVALVGDEATVKRYFHEDDHVRLQPENDAFEPIRTREAVVLGRVVGVFRRVS